MTIEICSRCVMPSTRPRIKFVDGVCGACLFAEEQNHIDWDARAEEFRSLVRECRGDGPYDCVVAFSGGKDSSVVAYKIREAGLRPLLVCWGQLLWTDVGRANFNRMCDLGFDILYLRHNQRVSRHLARRFFIERGHPKNHYDAAVGAFPVRVAINYKIPVVWYAEFGEGAYGGNILSEEHKRTRDRDEVVENLVGDDARNWVDSEVTEADLASYIYPDASEIEAWGGKAYYYSYFFKWSAFENALFAQKHLGFVGVEDAPGVPGRSDGSFEGFDSIDDMIDDLDFAMMHKKFGFGRATRFACRMIQCGYMTREAALPLIRTYDGEWPHRYIENICNYLGMSRQEVIDVAYKHMNPEIWVKRDHVWELRHPPA